MKNSSPLITIVTVVYNNVEHIEETIQSVINQDFENFEYLVVDGGSTDGTLDVIKKYADLLTYISEPDKGLFDAMNKGAQLAKGEWINFMNSGDFFVKNTVLTNVAKELDSSVDLFFGAYILRTEGVKSTEVIRYPKSLDHLYKGMGYVNLCHQSVFVRKELQITFPFNTKYSTSGDFELIYNLFSEGYNLKKSNLLVSNYLKGGFSTNTLVKARIRDFEIVYSKEKSPRVLAYYMLSISRRYFLYFMMKFRFYSVLKSFKFKISN